VSSPALPVPPAVTAPGRRLRRGPQRVRAVSITGLFVLACLYAISAGAPFLLPLTVALMLNFLLSPVVRTLHRFGLPEWLGAAIVVLGLLVGGAVAAYELARPATEWLTQAPQSLRKIQGKAQGFLHRFEKVSKTAEQVDEMTTVDPGDAPRVQLKEPGLGSVVFGGLQNFIGNAVIVFTLLFFLLASGDLFLRKITKLLPRLKDKKSAVAIAREIERNVSAYLLGTTLINASFGLVVAAVLALLRMPNPVFWGVVAGVTNFIPYLGGLLCTVLLGLAAMLAFDDPWRAALVPAVFFVINTLEGNVITPLIMGRRLMLNTPVLFVGLLYWWWVWGISGALLAVPIMATFKIVADHIDSLRPVAEFLGEESADQAKEEPDPRPAAEVKSAAG
jgi:predicted PurR-regulated permease PerM